jgi:LmbE family N-acetylglucosaminyl deacetylase
MKKVLVIAPHMDDEVIGCGATIARHVKAGDHVAVCCVANRAYGHEYVAEYIEREKGCCEKAREILGYQQFYLLDLPDEKLDNLQVDIIKKLEDVYLGEKPDVVYIPHRGDFNQDHAPVFTAARTVLRPNSSHHASEIYVYENPSGNDYICNVAEFIFRPSHYVNVSDELETKIAAMACYETESREYPHPRSPEGLRINAQKRGMDVNMNAAEAFMVMRSEWK